MSATISARKLKRYEAAENVAKAFRCYVGTPNYETEKRDRYLKVALDWTIYWLERGDKDRYYLPPEVPKQWKRNRDKASGARP